MQKIATAFFLLQVLSAQANAQDSAKVSPFSFSGNVDGYYSYYTDSVGIGNFQKFTSVSPRSNSFGLNVAMVTGRYNTKKLRACIGLHYGDIPLSSWSKTFNFIQEAYAGVRLSKKIWLDAGFFRTHTGAEALFPKENITSSVSIATFNEPYYEAGFRVNYKPTDKLAIDLYALNGYNIYEDNNKKKSFGLLAVYTFNDRVNIGYSNYLGDDAAPPVTGSRFRIFQSLFINYIGEKIKLQGDLDYAIQQNGDTAQNSSARMVSGFATIRYQAVKRFAVYSRGEFITDPSGFLSGAFTDNTNRTTGLKLFGITAGMEYKPDENAYIRFETRQLQCDRDQLIFRHNRENTNNRTELMLHMGVYF